MVIKTLNEQRRFFRSGQTKSYAFRMDALKKLYDAIEQYEDEILRALSDDLGKSNFEAYITEVGVIKLEITKMRKALKSYMKPRRIRHGIALFKAKSMLFQEPYGNVLIMSPWNYPFQLSISPLIGAIAAGNTAIIKVSEESKNIAELTQKMIDQAFDPHYIKVVTGDVSVSEALLELPFDYIFFTGSPRVGKIVMEKASKHLTPVTLELGGKSPAIVHDVNQIALAARRIAYGK